jgi:hypothetical protein
MNGISKSSILSGSYKLNLLIKALGADPGKKMCATPAMLSSWLKCHHSCKLITHSIQRCGGERVSG